MCRGWGEGRLCFAALQGRRGRVQCGVRSMATVGWLEGAPMEEAKLRIAETMEKEHSMRRLQGVAWSDRGSVGSRGADAPGRGHVGLPDAGQCRTPGLRIHSMPAYRGGSRKAGFNG